MAENKTKATKASVERYLAAIKDASRRKDCEALCALMSKATKHPAAMWGTAIVGFGSYHYVYESGREGDMPLVGFSSRKGDISVYGLGNVLREEPHPELGKHKMGKGCLYIRALSDIDLKQLAKLVARSVAARR
jgi:hypothetical protein